jgi:hypothetical protein
MLADQPDAWADYPAGSLNRLWCALRITFLHALWLVHWSLPVHERSAAAVVSLAVAELQRLILNQWRCAGDLPGTLEALPTSLLTAQVRAGRVEDFQAVWAHRGVLCQVLERASGGQQLDLLLSLRHPVSAP